MNKPKGIECTGCGIMVGEGYIETQLYQVGDYKICGWCRHQLARRGRLLAQPYNSHQYLYPDGRVVVEISVFGGGGKDVEDDRKCKKISSE